MNSSPIRSLSDDSLRICIADADYLRSRMLSSGLRRGSSSSIHVVNDAAALIESLASQKPHVALVSSSILDLHSVDAEDLHLFKRLRHASPETRMLLMTMDQLDKDAIVSAFQFGVRGLLSHQKVSFKVLRKCIGRIVEGQFWISTEQLSCVMETLQSLPQPAKLPPGPPAHLTKREKQVMELAANGLSNLAISYRLGISDHTVKKYLLTVFAKLGIHSRVELAIAVIAWRPTKDEAVAGELGTGNSPVNATGRTSVAVAMRR